MPFKSSSLTSKKIFAAFFGDPWPAGQQSRLRGLQIPHPAHVSLPFAPSGHDFGRFPIFQFWRVLASPQSARGLRSNPRPASTPSEKSLQLEFVGYHYAGVLASTRVG